MDTKLVKILTGLNLEPKKVKIYLALLEMGQGSVQEIAKKTSLKRTTLYPILNELRQMGLLYQTKIKKHTYFIPENPNLILEQFKARVDKLTKNIDALTTIYNKSKIVKRPKTSFFSGADGFKKIWQIIFRSGIKEFLNITGAQEMTGFVREGYITQNIIKEKIRRGIHSRQLIAFSEYAKEIIIKDKRENRVSKMLPHIYKIPFTILIFADNVALISPSFENIIMIIESESFTKTMTSLFEALWNSLP